MKYIILPIIVLFAMIVVAILLPTRILLGAWFKINKKGAETLSEALMLKMIQRRG